jgi:PAS domain S-box-containing protein
VLSDGDNFVGSHSVERGATGLEVDIQAEIDAIVLEALVRFGAASALVNKISGDRFRVISVAGLALPEMGGAHAFMFDARAEEAIFVVPDALCDERFCNDPLVVGQPHLRFYAGAALITVAGHRIGTLSIFDTQPRQVFSEPEGRALSRLAHQVMIQLELQRLRRIERIAAAANKTSNDAIIGVDAHNRIVHWNRAAEKIFGWSEIDALDQQFSLIVPSRPQTTHEIGMADIREAAYSGLVCKTVEVPAITRDGCELPVELSLARQANHSASTAGEFVAIIRDVSDRKKLEIQRDDVLHQLSEQMAAIEESVDGIAITDADGLFTFMNVAYAAMFGFTSGADALGLPWRSLYSSDEVARLEREAFPVLNHQSRWRGRSTGTRRDGTTVEQEISLSLINSGRIVVVTRDVGARIAAERDQALLRERLLIGHRQEALGQIAAGLAHDFNNCIAAIAGSASMILDQGSDGVRAHAKRILAATGNAGSLVDKMLTLGSRNRKQEEFDLGKTVTDVVELLRAGLAKSQRLHAALPPEPIAAHGDATELMQIILNLGINARDALGGAHGLIMISLSMWEPADRAGTLAIGTFPNRRAALIRITDNGSGIAAENIPHVFQPNYSSKAGNGSGLGLAIVARLVTMVGGGIALSTSLGSGTTFEIIWPLDQRSRSPVVPYSVAPPHPEQPLAGFNILVAEDDPLTLATLTTFFEAEGAEVGPCDRPEDALEALRSDPDGWALLVSDYDMPGMNGAELAAAAGQVRPDLPVLLCTAMPQAALLYKDMFTAIIDKPIIGGRLVDAAIAAIGKADS